MIFFQVKSNSISIHNSQFDIKKKFCKLWLTNVVHVHSDGLSSHGIEAEEVLCPLIQLKCMAVEGGCLDVVLCSNAGHMPSRNLPIAEAQELAALKHITVDCCEEIYTNVSWRQLDVWTNNGVTISYLLGSALISFSPTTTKLTVH